MSSESVHFASLFGFWSENFNKDLRQQFSSSFLKIFIISLELNVNRYSQIECATVCRKSFRSSVNNLRQHDAEFNRHKRINPVA
jgi:hypothetical protein